MFDYTFYGLKIRSDVELEQLVVDKSDVTPDVWIQCGEMPPEVTTEQECMCVVGEDMSWFINPTLKMYIEKGERIVYTCVYEEREGYFKSFILGYGMALLLLQRKLTAIHCSAIVINDKAYLIAGNSGSGKSTLTNQLLEEGVKFLADDIAVVHKDNDGSIVVQPAFPYQKLCRDVALEQGYALEELIYIDEEKDKFLVPCKDIFCNHKVTLGGMIILHTYEGEEVRCKAVEGINMLYLCANNLFLRPILRERVLSPENGQRCLEIIAAMDMCVIARPKGMDTISEVVEKAKAFIYENTTD